MRTVATHPGDGSSRPVVGVSDQNDPVMPHCTVRYNVRLVPKAIDGRAMDAVGIFYEEREPDLLGEPGDLLYRRLVTFSGAAGYALRDMVTRGNDWKMDVLGRIDPLKWDS